MNMQTAGHYGLNSWKIDQLVIQETGTYNTMFDRPYDTNISGYNLNHITERAIQNKGSRLNANVFTGIASSFLAPSSSPMGEIPIFNGWQEKRLRFMLVLNTVTNTGSNVIHYIQGFTSHAGISIVTKAIDPEMLFVINSITKVNRCLVRDAAGNSRYSDFMSSSNHLLSEPLNLGNSHLPTVAYGLRPEDVFTGMHGNYMSMGYSNQGNLTDTRRYIQGTPKASNRSNAMPANYLGRTLEGYRDGMEMLEFGQNDAQIYERARSSCNEVNIGEDSFMMLLQQNPNGANRISKQFRFSELQYIDPSVASRVYYMALTPTAKAGLHTAGSTEHWHGSDRITQVATIISQSIPALMMEMLIGKIHLRSTNMDVTGGMNTSIIDGMSLAGEAIVSNLELFKSRFEKEMMFDLTLGNQEVYAVEINADIYGQTEVFLSLNGSPSTPFVTASFADSLIVPVMTTNANLYQKNISDFDSLTSNINQAVGDATVSSLINRNI